MTKDKEAKTLRKKVCKLCLERVDSIDYKDANHLVRFITDRGKIVPRRVSGA